MFIDPVRDPALGSQSVAGGPGDVPESIDSAAAERLDEVDFAGLSDGELRDRVVGLVAERARLEGQYLAALGEMTSRCGPQGAAYGLREYTRMTSTQARHDARLADDLVNHGLSATLAALQAGEIQTSHAREIARETPKKHRRSEEEFLELCAAYPADTVARHPLAYQSLEVFADLAAEAADGQRLDPVDAELAFQRAERSGSMRLGDDGMWHLYAKLDFIAGREVSQALQAAVRAARHREGAEDSTRPQLTADAISDLIAGALKTRRANTNLLIIADYDLVNDQLANPRLDDGTPLSAQQLADLAVDAQVLPAVFSTDWSRLAMGRTRNASDAQRLVLAARDRGCIGCDLTSEHTQSHHIQYFEHGGHTDIPNLASLCEPCHRDLHQHDHDIYTPTDGRPRIRPPTERSGRSTGSAPVTARSP